MFGWRYLTIDSEEKFSELSLKGEVRLAKGLAKGLAKEGLYHRAIESIIVVTFCVQVKEGRSLYCDGRFFEPLQLGPV